MPSAEPTERPVRPTRRDVAERAAVSTAVVSYVVNGGPRPVASATRERVLDAMRELDYRPNAAARALALRRSTAIGLVVPDVSNAYFGALARQLTRRAFDEGYAVLLGDSDNDRARQSAQISSLVQRGVDGLIVISLDPSSVDDTGDVPTVYLDHRDSPGQRSILVDNTDGARQATEHLLAHGHRRIAHIGGRPGAPGADDRARGWSATLAAAGMPARDSDDVRTEYTRSDGYAAALRLLADPSDRPGAVFVASDVQALGVLRAARSLGLDVPGDLAVVSFDGTEDAQYADPPLSTIAQPTGLIVDAALTTVLFPDRPAPRSIPVELIVRESCGHHPASA